MRWVNDYKVLRDDEDADESEKTIYESRLRYVQNCIDCSLQNRDHILLNELWRNKSADTHEKYLQMQKENKISYGLLPYGEEGDDEARQERNEDKIMAELIEGLRAKYGNLETKSFYGDEERIQTIKNIYNNQNIRKKENIENCIVDTETKIAAQEYDKLKNYDTITIQKENEKNNPRKNIKKNNFQIQGTYIYIYINITYIIQIQCKLYYRSTV